MRIQILIAAVAVCLVVVAPLGASSSTAQSPPSQQASSDKTLDAVVKLLPTITSIFRNSSGPGGKNSSGLKRFGNIMQIFLPVLKQLTVSRAKAAGRPVDRKQVELFETFEFFTEYLRGVAASGGSLSSLTSNPENLLQDYTDLAVDSPKFPDFSTFLPGGGGNPHFIPKASRNPSKAEIERPETLIGHVRDETDTRSDTTQTVDYVTRRPSSRSRPQSSRPAQQTQTTTRRPKSNSVALFASMPGLTYNPSSNTAAPSPNYAVNVQFPPAVRPNVRPTPRTYAQTEKPTTERYTPRRPSSSQTEKPTTERYTPRRPSSSSATQRTARIQTPVPEETKAESPVTERYQARRISRPNTLSSRRQHSSSTSHQPANASHQLSSANQQSSSARQKSPSASHQSSSIRQQPQRPQFSEAEAEKQSSSKASTRQARTLLHPITTITEQEINAADAAGIAFFKLPGHSFTYSSLGRR